MGGSSAADQQVSKVPVGVVSNSGSPSFTEATPLASTSAATDTVHSGSISPNGAVLSNLAIALIVIGSILIAVLAVVVLVFAVRRHRAFKSDHAASAENEGNYECSNSAEEVGETPADFSTIARLNPVRATNVQHQQNQQRTASATIPHPNAFVNSFPSSITTPPTTQITRHLPLQPSLSNIDDQSDWDIHVRSLGMPLGMPPTPFPAHNRVNHFAPTPWPVVRGPHLNYPQLAPQLPPLPTPSPLIVGDDIGAPLVLRYQYAGPVLSPLSSRPVVTHDMLSAISDDEPLAFGAGWSNDDSSAPSANA
ncbi:hypothetical protein HDU83_002416 [Entophlyctis luteolus]|nr:hypothetical protein HDU83_002416 [Entophlyctis luteolus]